jgi:uncharacterized protein (DUF169 family)
MSIATCRCRNEQEETWREKMNVNEIRELGSKFVNVLHLKTKPIGFNFFKTMEEIPSSYETIQKRKVLCNIIGMARTYEIAVAISAENTKGMCPVADLSTGFGELPPQFAEKAVGAFAASADQTKKIVDEMKCNAPGKYAAIGVCPLDIIPQVPEVVQIWGDPTQMLELIYSNTWNNAGERVVLETNGHGASCYEALTWPIKDDRIRMCIADMGDKRHGFAGESEMILGVPAHKLAKLYEGLVATMKTLNRLPVLYNFDDVNFPVPKYALAHSPLFAK